jgi:hypothetical protein
MEPWAAVNRIFKFLPRFLANGYLSRVSRQLHSPANDKGNNKIIPRAVHRSPGISLTAEEKLSLKTVDEACATSHRLKWYLFPQNELRTIAQHVRKGEYHINYILQDKVKIA